MDNNLSSSLSTLEAYFSNKSNVPFLNGYCHAATVYDDIDVSISE